MSVRFALPLSLALAWSGLAAAQQADDAEPTPPRPWTAAPDLEVVQQLPYERAGRWRLTAFAAMVPNDPFVAFFPMGLRVGRFLNEAFDLELSLSYMDRLSVDRDLRAATADAGGARVALTDHPVARAQLDTAWTLLSLKGRVADGSVLHVRGALLAGFGALAARDADDAIAPRAEAMFGFGLEAHTGEAHSLRLEVRQSMFQRTGGGVLMPTELSIGIAHYFGGPLGGVR